MFRARDIFLVTVMLAAVGYTYTVKRESDLAMRQISDVKSQIKRERIAIDLLKADESLLTQPIRIQALADRFSEELHLAPITPGQFATLEQIPARRLRPEQDEDGLEEALAILGRGDELTTGSVRP